MSSKIRKGQMISTFGPGAIHVDSRGVSLLTSGIDGWFDGDGDIEPYKLADERLAKRLNVDHFRQPPDAPSYRKSSSELDKRLKQWLPVYRFPRWHVCKFCNRMEELSPLVAGSPTCKHCNGILFQVRFVASCKNGHLQDFPWIEWVHRGDPSPDCAKPELTLRSTKNATLADTIVSCSCGKQRNLAGIMSQEDGKTLSNTVIPVQGISFPCAGKKPWFGDAHTDSVLCDQPLVGMLRQATNLYYSKVISSIKLPIKDQHDIESLIDLLVEKVPSKLFPAIAGFSDDIKLATLKGQVKFELDLFTNDQILSAFSAVVSGLSPSIDVVDSDDEETEYRRQERRLLLDGQDRKDLQCFPLDLSEIGASFQKYFSHISRVERLTETRAFVGFDRIESGTKEKSDNHYQAYQNSIRCNSTTSKDTWLPAVRVYGEGIYLELNEGLLNSWQSRPDVKNRVKDLPRQAITNSMATLEAGRITPRFLLLHTLAHLLINRLVFDSGYSSSALRERLYCSDDPDGAMAGVLIYTSSGDSEGSLGGLVAMTANNQLINILKSALAEAEWCSSDPICSESRGQGPGSLNLAACHSCALLPETSCEHMNSLLDRRLLVSLAKDGSGFFDSFLVDG
ncbi:DUF1998 domain-containing protein [Cellvibrio sp. KY-GH-1]|uniref:DUF1998 domain-containing protein n=1 Tax=Cellvibrio sp. KY-GH-1 TaxID=2303332 RepID=UPI0012451C74|nr:DUF1998 domain-containing protein [Cellvibrio sp. KY-GH-1]QEY17664.1 DUF1998 domain-containing protein [Cellvibrio sp. KY-GH-1]